MADEGANGSEEFAERLIGVLNAGMLARLDDQRRITGAVHSLRFTDSILRALSPIDAVSTEIAYAHPAAVARPSGCPRWSSPR